LAENPNTYLYSRDEIRERLTGLKASEYNKDPDNYIENKVNVLAWGIISNSDYLIVDNTNLKASYINGIIKTWKYGFEPNREGDVEIILIDTPLDLAKKRVMERDNLSEEQVKYIEKQYEQLTELKKHITFDKIIQNKTMNKYYTPTIDEFHVGFRYEGYSSSTVCENKEWVHHWEPRIFKDGHLIYPGHGDFLIAENTRVKYLDESDIEELGWVRDEKDDRNAHISFYFKADISFRLFFYKETLRVAIEDLIEYCLFLGKIKNYNELRKVMKMLEFKLPDEDESKLRDEHEKYIIERTKQTEKSCYCGHTDTCDCGNPSFEEYKHNKLKKYQ
jgi:hypothetical protein